jgi:hypothetical protein
MFISAPLNCAGGSVGEVYKDCTPTVHHGLVEVAVSTSNQRQRAVSTLPPLIVNLAVTGALSKITAVALYVTPSFKGGGGSFLGIVCQHETGTSP